MDTKSEPDDSARMRTRGYLPHWERDGAIYFVTFRLADSLPRHVLETWRSNLALEQQKETATDRNLAQRIQRYLDSSRGACYLADPRIAALTEGALRYFDGVRYQLICWCIMPNHVHVVLQPLAGQKLKDIIQSWKSVTAHQANRVLGRSGAFWQREYYDHIVRDEEELRRVVRYVVNNPAKAKLADWKWVGVRDDWKE